MRQAGLIVIMAQMVSYSCASTFINTITIIISFTITIIVIIIISPLQDQRCIDQKQGSSTVLLHYKLVMMMMMMMMMMIVNVNYRDSSFYILGLLCPS